MHASPVFAEAVRRLARDAGLTTVVDVGAGGGELLVALHALDPSLELVGVDLADRPPALPADIAWQHEVPATTGALLVANEWLDDVPVDVVRADRRRLAAGAGRPGDRRRAARPAAGRRRRRLAGDVVAGRDAGEVGDRAEVGRPRDEAWAAAVGSLTDGLAVAIDYAHDRDVAPAGRQPHRLPRRSPGPAGPRRQL